MKGYLKLMPPASSFGCGCPRTPENTTGDGRCRTCRSAYYRERAAQRWRADLNHYRDRQRKRSRESSRRKRAAQGAIPRMRARLD